MRISDWSSDVCSSDLLSRSCGLGINAKMEALEGVEDERLDVTPVEAAIAASRRRQSDRKDAGGPSLLGKFKEARMNPAKLRSIAPVACGSERSPHTAGRPGKQKADTRNQQVSRKKGRKG